MPRLLFAIDGLYIFGWKIHVSEEKQVKNLFLYKKEIIVFKVR